MADLQKFAFSDFLLVFLWSSGKVSFFKNAHFINFNKKLRCCWGTARRSSHLTRNTLDLTNIITPRAVLYHIPIEFGPIGNSANRSTNPENPSLEPNME